MDNCCEDKIGELAALQSQQRRVLIVILVVNAVLFCVEFIAGFVASSTALLADSLDMLGDALVYGFSLFVLERSILWRTRAALLKGLVMAGFGIWVLIEAVLRIQAGVPPMVPVMAVVGVMALLGNTFCFLLLWRHRRDDINLRSTWLCSRNDLIANSAVLAAVPVVAWSGSLWPDVVVGLGIAALFLRTSAGVLREAWTELGRVRSVATESGG